MICMWELVVGMVTPCVGSIVMITGDHCFVHAKNYFEIPPQNLSNSEKEEPYRDCIASIFIKPKLELVHGHSDIHSTL